MTVPVARAALKPLTKQVAKSELKEPKLPNAKIAAPSKKPLGVREPTPAPRSASPANTTLPGEKTAAKISEPKKTQPSTVLKSIGSYSPAVRVGRSLETGSKYERAIKAEWVFGMLLIFMYPLWKPNFASNFAKWVSRQIAWTAVFIMLLLLASVSDRVAKLCAAFGGLALLALLLGPYVKDGQVEFSLNGANALKAATDKLMKASGTASSGAASEDQKNKGASESTTPTDEVLINLGDGSGSLRYRPSVSDNEYLRRLS